MLLSSWYYILSFKWTGINEKWQNILALKHIYNSATESWEIFFLSFCNKLRGEKDQFKKKTKQTCFAI